MPPADAPLADEEQFYRVEEVIRSAAECQCPACVQWTIVYDDGQPTEIGTSWQGDEGHELADNVCDLMNMAFARGAESTLEQVDDEEALSRG
jgi:hypothetical protein